MPTPAELQSYSEHAKTLPDVACFATKTIYLGTAPVFFIDKNAEGQCIFIAEQDSQEFLDDPKNTAICSLREIAILDPAIVPYLYAGPGSSVMRTSENDFIPIEPPLAD